MKTKPNLPALYELRDLMKTVKPEEFDQDKWPGLEFHNRCGCVGWHYEKKIRTICGGFGCSAEAGAHFNLPFDEAYYIFSGIRNIIDEAKKRQWPLPPFTPSGAVIRIEHIISLYEKKPINDTEFLEREVSHA